MNYLWKRFNLIILIFFNYYFFIRNILQTHFFWLGLGDLIGYAILYLTTIIHLILEKKAIHFMLFSL